MKRNRITHLALFTLLTFFLVLIVGCTRDEVKQGASKASNKSSEITSLKSLLSPTDNIVVVVVDTLRADRLPFYGLEENTAPFLNSLAENAVVFERAIAGCSSTAPAMASIFTSLYPSQHGVVTGMKASKRLMANNPKVSLNRIPEQLTTLGEFISTAGYPSYGASDNLNIGNEIGFLGGFEKFETFQYKGAPKINEVILSYEEEVKHHDKYFMYVHYIDPHAPYNKQAPWYDSERKDKQLAAYDSEIRYTDEHIKALFERYGWKDNALVVFLSDHGEEFGEHGGNGHGKNLFPEVIHVPFFIYHRNLPAHRIQDTVHTLDLMPTLADILGKEKEATWEGRSLAPYLQEELPQKPVIRFVYSELLRHQQHPRDSHRAAVEESWLYIKQYGKKAKTAKESLFDLQFDRYAKKDLANEQADTLTHLQGALKELDAKTLGVEKENIEVQMDQETVEHLKTLGYVN